MEVQKANTNWIEEAAQQVKNTGNKIVEKLPVEASKQKISEIKDYFKPFMPRIPKNPDIQIFPLDTVDPKELIDQTRESDGVGRYKALLNFQSELDSMSTDSLKGARDYLVNLMSDQFNNDDPFLGLLLNKVNDELDSRPGKIFPHPIRIDDIVKNPIYYVD